MADAKQQKKLDELRKMSTIQRRPQPTPLQRQTPPPQAALRPAPLRPRPEPARSEYHEAEPK
ncbi:MAG: hypothetical protein RI911_455, partial [Candidatus Parcubacteria bacterium]